MTRYISVFLLLAVLLSFFALPVLANGVEGTVANDPVAVPDTSPSDQAILADISASLDVIQSQLWIILVVGFFGYIYKFFRIFF